MKFANHTVFSSFIFESIDPNDRMIYCLFCRGTFDLVDGERLEPAKVQEPVVLADKYRGDPLKSSVEIDSDLVPLKLASDITLNATAVAPNDRESPSWTVDVSMGTLSKSVRVCGPRRWQYTALKGWHLTAPDPCRSVPLRYELAFGGTHTIDGTDHVYERNPVGTGFLKESPKDRDRTIVAPQIEDPGDPIGAPGRDYRPAGFGPIAKHWFPRRTLCGTADAKWKDERWPLRPKDFDFRYYNSASDGMVYPGYLTGREDVCISGCTAHGPVRFRLPGIDVSCYAAEQNLATTIEPMKLDSLHIDLEARKVFLTWRTTFAKTGELFTAQILPGRFPRRSLAG